MNVELLKVDRDEAEKMWRKYQSHKNHQTPVDEEIERIYRLIAQGKTLVRALESIRANGLNEDGLPKLAIARADAKECFLNLQQDGSGRMADQRWVNGNTARSRYFDFPRETFTGKITSAYDRRAVAPHIPPDIRPARGVENYTILWEAVWQPQPPIDPYLLRRVGKGDIWLVVGAWSLTSVERAVMANRITARN